MIGASGIRPARPDEVAQILTVWREADATPSPTDTREEVLKLLREPAAVLLVAEADGRLVGTVIGGWDGWRGNIYRVAVSPAYRRRGLARALVAEADRLLRDELAALFEGGTDTIELIKWKELYETMEAVTDRCEDVLNVVEGITLKMA